MKTILLTGVTGFIGRYVLESVKGSPAFRDYNIVALSSTASDDCTTIAHKGYTFTKDDFLRSGVSAVDVVIHMGAFTPKNGKEANNQEGAYDNIRTLQHLLTNLPSVPSKFIFLSTLDVYADPGNTRISEETLTDPATLYGWSKLYNEKMLHVWAATHGAVHQVLRIGHIYGAGEEKYQKIIPLTIRKILSNEAPVIFSKGLELRSFLHVSDCARAILRAVDLEQYVGPVNVVSGRALSVNEIVDIILKASGRKIEAVVQGKDIPVKDLVFDNRKMTKYLTDESVSIEQGIKEELINFKL